MKKNYVSPELKLAGDADEVVLGGGAAGADFAAEDMWDDVEYLTDGGVE